MDYSHYRQLKIDIVDRIATITMNRPDTLNVVQAEMHTELTRIFPELENDRDVDVMILTGAGRAFCAGGDIVWMQEGVDDPLSFNSVIREGKQLIFGILDCEKPIIAKVNGHAVGLGATLALYCDIIFMAQNAKIGDPHVKVGLTAGDGGAVIWPQLIGYARAKEYLMTGELINATDAKAMGLVNRVVPREELDAAVDAFVRNLNAGAKLAIRGTKTTVNIGLRQLAHSIMDASLAYEAMSNASEDHAEGIAAFREGRAPIFKGR
jgi:enoyl-CoA hydratase